MQRLPDNREGVLFIAVQRIIDDRMADIGHMDADLMGSSRFQTAFDPRVFAVPPLHRKMRNRLSAVFGDDGHFNPVFRMPSDSAVNNPLRLDNIAVNEGPIAAPRRMSLDLRRQSAMSRIRLGSHHDPRRILVQAVNDAGTDNTVYAGQLAVAMMEQGIDQGAVTVSRRRMDDHAARLIDNDDIAVFINDLQRNILCRRRFRRRFRQQNGQQLPGGHAIIGLYGLATDSRPSLTDQRLHKSAGKGQLPRQTGIKAQSFFRRRQRNCSRFHHGLLSPSRSCVQEYHNNKTTPATIPISATLKTGHTRKSKKSVTAPWKKRSTAFPKAPPSSSPSPYCTQPCRGILRRNSTYRPTRTAAIAKKNHC